MNKTPMQVVGEMSMRVVIVAVVVLLAGCGVDSSGGADAGCESFFRDWTLLTCGGTGCPGHLSLSGARYGVNQVRLVLPDAAICQYDLTLNTDGDNTASGTGTIENGILSVSGPGAMTLTADAITCNNLNNIQFDWRFDCNKLTLTSGGIATTYN